MKRYGFLIPLAIVLMTGYSSAATKPAKKQAPATTHHETVGTEQLKGEYGLMEHTYTLGKTRPWNICLKSAEYSAEAIRCGDQTVCPKRDQKLLVLHLTVHNPQKDLALMRFDTIRFTAVDANDKNWESVKIINSEATKEKIDQRFKPAQKMDIYTAIIVPAAGEIPKLMLTGSDNTVIRYDLRGKVKALPMPFADPSDKSGASALADVPAEMGVSYPLAPVAVSVDSISYADGPVDGKNAPTGGRFLIATLTVKYIATFNGTLRFDSFQVKGVDSDGLDIKWGGNLLAASSDRHIDVRVEPGQEIKCRAYFPLGKDVTPKSIVITGQQNGRSYRYDVL